MTEHMGRAISIRGATGISWGTRRHAKDTDSTLVLTLYDQEGELRELVVPRTRDSEVFQEWLRRFDRYTPRERD